MKMPLRWMPLAATAALAVISACAKERAPAPVIVAAPGAPDIPQGNVVATLGAEKITAGQLDEQLKSRLSELEEQYQKQKHQLRKDGLDQMIIERLVKAEAQKKGMTDEQWLKAEIDDKVPAPPEDQVKQVYEQNAAQLPPGSTLETFRPRIVEHLTRSQKQERARAVFEQLRQQAQVVQKLPEPARARKQVEAKGPARGPEKAPITLVEFSDFQCPFCSRAHDTVEQVMQAYAGKIRLVFRQFPLEFHAQASKAAEASLCANEQGKFWEYHDALFKNQQKLDPSQLKEHAAALGLDGAAFAQCLDSGKHAATVQADMEAGRKVGVSGTPAFFVNGVMLSGAQPLEEFKRLIDSELATN